MVAAASISGIKKHLLRGFATEARPRRSDRCESAAVVLRKLHLISSSVIKLIRKIVVVIVIDAWSLSLCSDNLSETACTRLTTASLGLAAGCDWHHSGERLVGELLLRQEVSW